MDPSLVFLICNTGVLPFWLLLAVAPHWIWTQRLVHSVLVPVLLGGVYLWGVVTAPALPEGGGFGSLEAVMLLFTVPQGVLIGWVHYLVFDLFIGAWEVRDAKRHDIPHLALVPCLFFTLMLGPIGLLMYCALRGFMRRSATLVEA